MIYYLNKRFITHNRKGTWCKRNTYALTESKVLIAVQQIITASRNKSSSTIIPICLAITSDHQSIAKNEEPEIEVLHPDGIHLEPGHYRFLWANFMVSTELGECD